MMLSRFQKRALEDIYEYLMAACALDDAEVEGERTGYSLKEKHWITLEEVNSALETLDRLAKDFEYELFSEGDARSLEDEIGWTSNHERTE
jgi:hypothetical protein